MFVAYIFLSKLLDSIETEKQNRNKKKMKQESNHLFILDKYNELFDTISKDPAGIMLYDIPSYENK